MSPPRTTPLKFFKWAYEKGGKMAQDLDYIPMPDNVDQVGRGDVGQATSSRNERRRRASGAMLRPRVSETMRRVEIGDDRNHPPNR